MSCLVCESNDQQCLFANVEDFEYRTYHGVDYFLCAQCGQIEQRPLPAAGEIPSFYPPEYRNYLESASSLLGFLKQMQFRKMASSLSPHIKDGKILELGVGNGALLLALKELGYTRLYGSDFADGARSKLSQQGITVNFCNLEEQFPFEENFDTIIMNNVIEHFLNPLEVLKRCHQHLCQGGRVIIITPNGKALERDIFGQYWAGFHAPRHTHIFNHRNIDQLCKITGFKSSRVEPVTDPGQWSISLQNLLQSRSNGKAKLKNGLAFYTVPLSLVFAPLAMAQNLTGRSTSMLCVLNA